MPSDTYFTVPPGWTWYIIPYFFVGGIAGGSYFISVLLDWFGRPQDRPVVRIGYYTAAIGVILSGILLIMDLTRPLRFWHMLFQSHSFPAPIMKWWSPISIGAWALLFFGLFATLSAVGALHDAGRLRQGSFLARGPIARVVQAAGGFFAFFIAGYTGVLLSTTNRPVWADSQFVGLLFLLSGASTAAATLLLFGRRHPEHSDSTEHWLRRFDSWVIILELAVLVVFLVSLGPVIEAWFNLWGLLLLVGVVGAGQLLPLALHYRPRWFRERLTRDSGVAAAVLVLIGGLLLRTVVIMASHRINEFPFSHS
jgi:formate-dependent nitrite reductase membrane component NrfD